MSVSRRSAASSSSSSLSHEPLEALQRPDAVVPFLGSPEHLAAVTKLQRVPDSSVELVSTAVSFYVEPLLPPFLLRRVAAALLITERTAAVLAAGDAPVTIWSLAPVHHTHRST